MPFGTQTYTDTHYQINAEWMPTRAQALPPLVAAVAQEPEDHVRAATAWALGQLGRHTPDHAKAVADTGVLSTLVALESSSASSEDLATKARRSLKSVVSKVRGVCLGVWWGRRPMRLSCNALECLRTQVTHDSPLIAPAASCRTCPRWTRWSTRRCPRGSCAWCWSRPARWATFGAVFSDDLTSDSFWLQSAIMIPSTKPTSQHNPQVLANDAPGRSQFVHSGGLAAVQQLAEAPGSKLKVNE
jgi:hypothetical protein